MMYLKKIKLHVLYDLIRIAYEDDSDLLNKYHIKKLDLMSAVDSTFKMIYDASKIEKLINYAVIYDKKPIGYVTVFKDGTCLYSYAISVKYRKKEILREWFDKVEKVLSPDFYTMLYSNNLRAAKFLEKMGLEKISHKGNVVTYAKQNVLQYNF